MSSLNTYKQVAAASLLLSMASVSSAEGWSGKGEAGISLVSGNSQSEIVTAGLEFGKTAGKWDHSAKLSVLQSQSTVEVTSTSTDANGAVTETTEDVEQDTADSLLVGWVSKYAIGKRGYAFGDLRYLDDQFDSFEAVKTYALGYGYKIVVQEDINWEVSLGLGYRDTSFEAGLDIPEEDRDIAEPSGVLTSIYTHQFTASTEFSNETRIEGASENTFAQNVAALSVAMSDALALKVKYDVRHNTDPAPGNTSTDKITSVNIVYNF